MSQAPTAPLKTRERFALLYSDGSFGGLRADETLEDALVQAEEADFNERDPAHFTRVLRVTLIENEEIERPPVRKSPPGSARLG